jgi:hypothetical protein
MTMTRRVPSAPALDARARLWVRDLQLKSKNPVYLSHPDFLPGYRFGYEVCRDEVLSNRRFSTLKSDAQRLCDVLNAQSCVA